MLVSKWTPTQTIAVVRFAVVSFAILVWFGEKPAIAQKAGYRIELEASDPCYGVCYFSPISGPWLETGSGRFFATPAYNLAGGPTGKYLPSTVFDFNFTPRTVWASAPIPAGSVLNVFSYDASLESDAGTSCIWTQLSQVGGTSNNVTVLDQLTLNGFAGRRLLVQPTVAFEWLLAENFGVWYSPLALRWTIFLEDSTVDMPEFVIFWGIDDSCDSGITFHAPHVASVANTVGNVTYLDEISGIHRPSTILLVTQLYSSTAPVYNDHPIGVWFNTYAGAWAIFNEDKAPMPLGAQFMVATVDVVLTNNFETGDFRGWSSHVP